MSFTVRDAVRLYGIDNWGAGYFDVNPKGHLTVRPNRDERSVDLFALIQRLRKRKVRFPMLIRFPQILSNRVNELFDAFDKSIAEYGYGKRYLGVFPVKVNQKREVVDELVAAGRPRGMGLEAGSKGELAIALSHKLDPDALIICNGYKDAPYVRMALRGVELGKRVFLIVEKPQEIALILRVAKEVGRRAAHRDAHPPPRPRLGQVGEVGRAGREVRAHHAGGARGRRGAEARRRAVLVPPAALPRREPDPRDQAHQDGGEGGRARLREAARRRGAARGARRGRRARRRLRRLARRRTRRR